MNNLVKIILSSSLFLVPGILLAVEGNESMKPTGVEINGSKDVGDKTFNGLTPEEIEDLKSFCKLNPSSLTIVANKHSKFDPSETVKIKVSFDGKEFCAKILHEDS